MNTTPLTPLRGLLGEGELDPEILLPIQYREAQRELTNSQRLILALLVDALDTLARARQHLAQVKMQHLYCETRAWLCARDVVWGSFAHCCGVLKWDAETARKIILARYPPLESLTVIERVRTRRADGRRCTRQVRRPLSDPSAKKGD